MTVGNLQLIKSESISSASTTFDVTDCFGVGYDVYYLAFQNFNSTSGGNTIKIRFLDSSNNPITASEYDWAYLNLFSYSSFTEARATNQNIINFGTTTDANAFMNTSAYIFNPDDTNSYTFLTSQGANGYNLEGRKQISVLTQTSVVKGIRVDSGSTNMDEGTLSVYGVK
jgi:hypothetical protein